MPMVKKRTFYGVICEQEVFHLPANTKNIKTATPKARFKNDDERNLHKEKQAKRQHAKKVNANFTSQSLYSTLTFDNDWEVHTFEDAKIMRNRYYDRLKRKYPNAKIHIYMGRGKVTDRIHFHMLTDGIPESFILEKWDAGKVVRVKKLRKHNFYNGVDHGEDYTGLANYLFDHWTKEQGGQHYKGSRNMSKIEPEETKAIKRRYSEKTPPPAPKGYKLVEAKANYFGYMLFKYVLITDNKRKGVNTC